MRESQNFANHGKIVPAFHFFLIPVLVFNVFHAGYWLLFAGGHHAAWGIGALIAAALNVLMALALLVLAFLARLFALGAQDRVIRLEERIRYQQLLPDNLKLRINEFSTNQLVALRFAGDEELPALARKVLDDNLTDRRAIKQMIQNWRADYQRI
jgi:uncharacterized protein DUF6526